MRQIAPVEMWLLLAIFHTQFQNNTSPTATFQPNIKAAGSLKADLVGVNAGVEHFVGRKYHQHGAIQGIAADFLGAQFGEQIANRVKIELVPYLMLTVTAVRFDHFENDNLFLQSGAVREDVRISGILSELFRFGRGVSQMSLDDFPHPFINCHTGTSFIYRQGALADCD
jgi:hypothetical protein